MLLHHYPNSPFAEKIRALLGFKKAAWTSVIQPMMMPKPDMQTLTGGYRRIPILQIGADVYCDTALMAQIIDKHYPSQPVHSASIQSQATIIAQWADSTLFGTAMAFNFSPKGAEWFFKDTQPEQAKAFADDRKAMRGGAARMAPAEATPAYVAYIKRISDLLGDKQFLFGDSPSIADFSCYHPLWFTWRVPPLKDVFSATPNIGPWIERMITFGQHPPTTITSPDQALALAKSCEPIALPDAPYINFHGIDVGTEVTVMAESFGLETTVGRLVQGNNESFTLARESTQTGVVHIHFPRIGFVIKAL
jgi:glutathione S-transferase